MAPPIQLKTFKDSTNSSYSFLVHTIESSPLVLGPILECLRLADVQKLSVCCKAFNNGIPQAMIQYLENFEVLQCLKRTNCLTDDTLFQKLCKSLKEHPDRARIMSGGTAGFGIEVVSYGDLLEGYREYAWISYEPDIRDNSLTDMNRMLLEQIIGDDPVYQGAIDFLPDGDSSSDDDSQDVSECDSEDDDDEENEQRKRIRRMECQNKINSEASSSGCCCPTNESIDRFFYLDENQREPYCGYCLDEFPLLKLRFCFQHVKGSNTIWRMEELDCAEEKAEDPDTYQRLGVEEDEFLVDMYYLQPYETGYLRFIGKGPRK